MNIADLKYELEVAQAALIAQRDNYNEARKARNRLAQEAIWAGVRPVDVASITGLSRARIAQLTKPKRKKRLRTSA